MTSTPVRIARALAFLALNPWLGIVAQVAVLTGMSLALGLSFTVVGGLVLATVTFGVARLFGMAQRRHLRFATDEDIGPPQPWRRGTGFWGNLSAPLRSIAAWKAFLFWIVEPILAVLTFSLVFALLSAGVVGLTLPLYAHRLHGVGDDIPAFGLGMACIGGAAALLTALAGSLLAMEAHLALARALLGPSRTQELQTKVSTLGTARDAALDAAEAERRRIERDLHDGTQQRLVALAMDLGRAKEKFATDPDGARALVDDAHREVKVTMAELRSLTRGLRPSVLEDRGLDAALSALAARSPVPVDIDVELPHRPPPAVESAAYFVVAEALTNIARHAQAAHAAVRIGYDGADLVVEVGDDGVGNARRVPGGGLDGLSERLAAFEGSLVVVSPEGGPTLLRVELPCGS